jgi:hypothetical protein
MAGDPRQRPVISAQLVVGLGVVTLGVLFLLDNMNVLDARDYVRLWPVVFVAIGIAQISQARAPARVVSGLIWILVGGILVGNRLDFLPWRLWDFWPLLIVVIGAYIVWLSMAREPARAAGGAGMVSGIAVMGGFQRKIRGTEFRGAELTAFMGGCELDLREASLSEEKAVVNVFALMGGAVLRVPETWLVVNEVFPFMGGVEDKTRPPAGGTGPRLVIRGFVMMGGVEIKN